MSELSIRQRLGLEAARMLRHSEAKEHRLRQLFWECTLRCNIACLHCGSDCKQNATVPDMPAEDFLKVIDGISPHVNPNTVNVYFVGGEPLVRKDLEEVGWQLFQRGYPWGTVTNGYMLDAKRLQSLLQAGLQTIAVSLDGLKDDHNWLRGNPQSFDRALNAIKLLVATKNLTWDVVTCVNQRSLPHLAELKKMLYDLGLRHWRIFTIFPVGRAAKHPDLQLTPAQYRQLMDMIVEWRNEGDMEVSYACEGFLGRYEGRVRNHLYQCCAGTSTASVRIDGAISGCLSIRAHYDQGNIYQDDFWDVWTNRFQPYRDTSWKRQGECADCSFFRYCEGNGMHLRRDDGSLIGCNLNRLSEG